MNDTYRPLSWAEIGRVYDAAAATADECCAEHDSLCALVMGEHGPCCDECPEWGGAA